ncbi:MAG: T9SS type A sorting domain-containing protein, partial [Bacteroidota bacterium]
MDVSNLNIVWMKEIRLNNLTANQDVIIGSIYETANGNLHVLGFVVNESNMFMITIDTSAQIMDFKYIFKSVPPQTEIPGLMKRIRQSPDKTKYFFRLGVQNNSSANYIGVIDTSGTTLKYSSYPNVNTLIQTRDGNYAICGEMDLIRKLDTNFQTMYTIKSPWLGSRYVVIGEADDGGLFVGGTANILPTRGDMAFIKAEPHGGINSVQEVQDLAAQIQTSPNPATTQVHITSPVKIESYTINNTSGTQLQSGVLENDNNIDISQLPQGLYFLQ